MQKVYLNSQIYLLLFSVIFTTSCSSQISENNSAQSVAITTEILSKGNDSINTPPRIDSVLQFSVMITSMFEDSKGNFWFGSHGDGLCRYDGKQFTYFTVKQGLPNGTVREIAPGPDWSKTRKINAGNQIGSIQEDKNGNIWLKNGDNIISKFDGQAFRTIHPDKESTLLTNRSNKEWKTELDYLWFGSWYELGLYRYDGNKLVHLTFPHPYGSNDDGVSELYKDNEGNIWFGTMESGTFRYDGKSFTRITEDDEIGTCRSVFQDNTGRIWITNNRFGLYYLEGDSLTNFTKEYLYNNKDLKSNEFKTGIQSIEQDKNGDLWFGTFGNGLWRYDGKKLTHYTIDNSLPIVTVKTIYKDKSGKLWFGIGEGTVYGFNGKSFYRFDGKESIK